MRVVIDTNVFVAGLRSNRGVSFKILEMLPEKSFGLLLSVPLMLEYESVFKRREIGISLSSRDIDAILNMIAAISEHIKLYYLWRPFLSDPKDDMILELAVGGNADSIVTFNERDFKGVEKHFGISIISPKIFFHQVKNMKRNKVD
jgi:putative PIN family toxin of toxin-antitoxin system